MNQASYFQENPNFNYFQKYLREFVYGGVDGAITTFAVVAGAVGANLDSSIILILGFANLFADGFSMSIGAYLSSKTDKENYFKYKNKEYWEVEHTPESEKKEIESIYRKKGFEGTLLQQVVEVIISDRERWVEQMMKEELNMVLDKKNPQLVGLATFLSFIVVGFIPLLMYVYDYFNPTSLNLFWIAGGLTAIAFLVIGGLKSLVNQTNILKSMLESLGLGLAAALVAYYVGSFLEAVLLGS
ncbi:VIT1/CCC1 transporter family protein [Pleomorphovibrio marinus]|uniref:VIT1/CCC1 transporter family protein n=1 Tax=Pleomorphovibrio marinus TaxID=2164132 RepID=UPI000E09F3AC|nr:VIT1/CCC1 transporter family protein [Pleomorphovibrio marinus]